MSRHRRIPWFLLAPSMIAGCHGHTELKSRVRDQRSSDVHELRSRDQRIPDLLSVTLIVTAAWNITYEKVWYTVGIGAAVDGDLLGLAARHPNTQSRGSV